MLQELLTVENLTALLTLTTLEIVLGIDNIVFIAILVGKLPPEKQARARTIGLALAMVMRILLLFSIKWVIGLVDPVFSVAGKEFSWRDIILLSGGLFLVWKATKEVHEKMQPDPDHDAAESPIASAVEGAITDDRGQIEKATVSSYGKTLVQILLLDLVFSLDSVITAVGMADKISIMVTAVVIAIGVMMVFAGAISRFVERNPTIKMLALSFLLMIGVLLIVEGWGGHINKGYIYFAMGFSLVVEVLNLRVIKKQIKKSGMQPKSPGDSPA